MQAPAYFVGWDVVGWNCDKNGESQDAIVILDTSLALGGKHLRANQRTSTHIANTSSTGVAFDAK